MFRAAQSVLCFSEQPDRRNLRRCLDRPRPLGTDADDGNVWRQPTSDVKARQQRARPPVPAAAVDHDWPAGCLDSRHPTVELVKRRSGEVLDWQVNLLDAERH
jgi:hypothetical protein